MLFQKRIVSITLDIYMFIGTKLTSECYALFICSVRISFHCLYNVFKVYAYATKMMKLSEIFFIVILLF